MLTLNTMEIKASRDVVFELAANVARWPELLPHYRWVKTSQDENGRVLVEMAARRGFIPVWWRSIQEVDAEKRVVRYKHIGGATTGMDVEWMFLVNGPKVTAVIVHEWHPRWRLPSLVNRGLAFLAGELFIKVVADRTLRHIKRHAESMNA